VYRRLRGFNEAGSTSASLINKLQEYDDWAWSQFMNIYGATVFARYVEAGLDEDLAVELTQQVVVDAYRQINKYEFRSFRGWLWTIAKRRLVDHIRRLKRPDRAAGGSGVLQRMEQLSTSENWHAQEDVEIAKQVFHRACDVYQWPDNERKEILSYLSGNLTGKEAAEEIGIKPGAFYKRISRLLKDIRGFGE
jgi:RNA polymerase sigma factor (sigma-70 family)